MDADPTAAAMAAVRHWAGVEPPNEAARRGLGDMAAVIAEVEKARAGMAFEDEPSSFEAALRELKEAVAP